MRFDFTSLMDRTGHDAMALDALGTSWAPGAPREGFDAIPMWVADMNFPTAPSIVRSIRQRLDHPAFGYFHPRSEYYDAIIRWHEQRHGVEGLKRIHIGYENGVLGGVVSALEAFTAPGDKVLVHSPTYIGFSSSIANSGRELVRSPLVRDSQGIWRMDYDDMDRTLGKHHIHAVVLCSPHNPTGRVWEQDELERALELFVRHRCVVIADEIWSDIILTGHKHIPFQSLGHHARQRCIALYAPSKTFNLAGLVGSYHIIYDEYLRDRMRAQASKSHYNDMNVLSMYALMGAYEEEGSAWVDELCQVLSDNIEYMSAFLHERAPEISFARPQGTYMMFLDCSRWCTSHGVSIEDLLRAGWDVGVAWQDGRPFGGEETIRLNLALPRSRVEEACRRLDRFVFSRETESSN